MMKQRIIDIDFDQLLNDCDSCADFKNNDEEYLDEYTKERLDARAAWSEHMEKSHIIYQDPHEAAQELKSRRDIK